MAGEHPLQGLMKTAMENIKEMVDVNTIIGDPVETEGNIIIPVSKVGFGFAAGGSEFTGRTDPNHSGGGRRDDQDSSSPSHPFGGGSGGGVSITPIAFIVIGSQGVRLLHTEDTTHLYDRLIDIAPQVLEKFGIKKKKNKLCNEEMDS